MDRETGRALKSAEATERERVDTSVHRCYTGLLLLHVSSPGSETSLELLNLKPPILALLNALPTPTPDSECWQLCALGFRTPVEMRVGGPRSFV